MAKHKPPAVGPAKPPAGGKPPKPKKGRPAVPEPGPGDAGKPWCPGCKRYHPAPASKAEWAALACKGANPFPAPKPARSGPALDRAMAAKGRLPDGSAFAVAYAAATKSWAGTLSFPDGRSDKPPVKTFRGDAPGVFGLLAFLDRRFRAWAARHPDHPALAGNTPDPKEGRT